MKVMSKSLDFAVSIDNKERVMQWISALESLISIHRNSTSSFYFNEKSWLTQRFRAADRDKNGKLFLKGTN